MNEKRDETDIVAELLLGHTCFLGKGDNDEIILEINANDIFYWGCADSEELRYSEILDFYKMATTENYGEIKWVCRKRKLRPQIPWVEILKKEGAWTDELESYPAPVVI